MILKNKATVTCINSCSWQAEKCTFVLIRNTSSSLALKFMMKLCVSVMNVPTSVLVHYDHMCRRSSSFLSWAWPDKYGSKVIIASAKITKQEISMELRE